MNDSNHSENVYAFSLKVNDIVHISKIEQKDKGLGTGYSCMGCNRPMQAVLSIIDNRKKFFRHHITEKGVKKCTYSDESYRHKLAKDILQMEKNIAVPNLYKYVYEKDNKRKFLIKESTIIEADKVLIEHYLYENENGEIEFSKEKKDKTDNELLIKPDVLFLDSQNKPILIIELVATSKPDTNKLIKLKRLGINAIQVRIPKDSPESIKLTFKHTNNTYWIYNYEEDRFDTLSIPESSSDRISEPDELQRKFFEENFTCRSAQIRNLIRGLGKILESEQYNSVVKRFRSELQRTSDNTEQFEQRLDERRAGVRSSGIKQHSSRREKLEIEKREFEEEETSLERRYNNKREELQSAITEAEFQQEQFNSRTKESIRTIESERYIKSELECRIRDLSREFEDKQSRIEKDINNELDKGRQIQENTKIEIRLIRYAKSTIDSRIEEIRYESDKQEKYIESEINRIESEINTNRESIIGKYPSNREEYNDGVKNGSIEQSPNFIRECKKLRELDDTLKIYCEHQELYSRMQDKN